MSINHERAIILALDTSTEACSAAVLIGEDHFSEFEVCPREHNKRILPMVDSVLSQANITLDDVDCIAFGRGPGSFTGVRIASGIVQGMAYGADKPVVGISSLAAMAHALYRVYGDKQVISAIDARMNEIYLGVYHTNGIGQTEQLLVDQVCSPDNALDSLDKSVNWRAIGTGWHTYQTILTEQINAEIETQLSFPNAIDIAHLALTEFAHGKVVNAEQACPIYVRDQVTWQKLPGK